MLRLCDLRRYQEAKDRKAAGTDTINDHTVLRRWDSVDMNAEAIKTLDAVAEVLRRNLRDFKAINKHLQASGHHGYTLAEKETEEILAKIGTRSDS